jgi:hypothetical protein
MNSVWLTDRSRIMDGRGFCQMARFLGYHFGPTGYGIQLKGTRLPLMTGIAGHEGLAPILEWCRNHDPEILQALSTPLEANEILLPVPEQVIRDAVKGAQAKYYKAVEVRGFAYLADDQSVQYLVREQNYLIEGLIWAWCLEVLPELLRRSKILEVEHDDTYICDCTCGLGDGILALADHEARECLGIGLMCRPDFISEQRITAELEYHEFKTTSVDSPMFRDKWETMIQMFAATLDAERRLGRPVSYIYIHALIKGRREGEWSAESGSKDGMVRQQSVFCYGYRKPAMPPMEAEEWRATYEYFDEFEGKKKRLGTKYKKTGIWELPGVPEGMSPAEFWVKWIPAEARKKNLLLLGPFNRQEMLVPEFMEEVKGDEGHWREICWQLYEKGQALTAAHGEDHNTWADPEFQSLLHRLVHRSYECRRYGLNHRCAFEDMCMKREGWADPLGSGKYIPRRPHHKDEEEAAIARGLLLPEEGAGDAGEEAD